MCKQARSPVDAALLSVATLRERWRKACLSTYWKFARPKLQCRSDSRDPPRIVR